MKQTLYAARCVASGFPLSTSLPIDSPAAQWMSSPGDRGSEYSSQGCRASLDMPTKVAVKSGSVDAAYVATLLHYRKGKPSVAGVDTYVRIRIVVFLTRDF